MLGWLKQYALGHVLGIVLCVVGLLAFRSWLASHDAAIQADTAVKAAQVQIKDLQARAEAIEAAAAKKVIVLQKEAKDVKTAPAALAKLPELDIPAVPLRAEPMPDAPSRVSVDAVNLYQRLNTCAQCDAKLTAAEEEAEIQKAVIGQKDIEIQALKHKPGFWRRLKHDAITIGIGVAIGYATAKH